MEQSVYKDLYEFISGKAKQKKIKIEDLPKLCGYSRSSIYRYMKGISPIGPDVEARFSVALDLSKTEQKLFKKYILQSSQDESMLETRRMLDNLFFSKQASSLPAKKLDFIYYNNEKYLRSIDEIFDMLLQSANAPSFSCRAFLINCVSKSILPGLAHFFNEMNTNHPSNFFIEHIIPFVKDDYVQNLEVFINLVSTLPLASLENYQAYISQHFISKSEMLFHDSILLDCSESASSEHQYYWISFSDTELSSCISFNDPFLYEFLLKNYMQLKTQYNQALFNPKNFLTAMDEIRQLESNDVYFMIKRTPSYRALPASIYRSLLERNRDNEYFDSIIDLLIPAELKESYPVDMAISASEQRYSNSFQHKNIDICTQNGLKGMASSGLFSDHLLNFPPFNKNELRNIFETLRDRSLKKDDPYELYILKENFSVHSIVAGVSQAGEMIFGYSEYQYQQGIYDHISFKNDSLCKIFTDYIENHLIPNYAMDKRESTEYLNRLIESLG